MSNNAGGFSISDSYFKDRGILGDPNDFLPVSFMDELKAGPANWMSGFSNVLGKDSKFMGGANNFGSLLGIGKDAFNIWNMFDERSLANKQWDTMKKYAALNAGNQGARLAYSIGANNAALDSAAGRPVDRGYMNEADNIKSSIG